MYVFMMGLNAEKIIPQIRVRLTFSGLSSSFIYHFAKEFDWLTQ